MDGISQNFQNLSTYSLNTDSTKFGVLPRCFRSYGLWLNISNPRVKQIDISESTDINQSTSMNRFYPTKASIFIRIFCFPIIHHNSIFSTHVRRVCYSNKWKAWHLFCSILKLLMVIKQLKSDSHLPKNFFICFHDSLPKIMKSIFYFILKAFFVLKIFKFLSWLEVKSSER